MWMVPPQCIHQLPRKTKSKFLPKTGKQKVSDVLCSHAHARVRAHTHTPTRGCTQAYLQIRGLDYLFFALLSQAPLKVSPSLGLFWRVAFLPGISPGPSPSPVPALPTHTLLRKARGPPSSWERCLISAQSRQPAALVNS